MGGKRGHRVLSHGGGAPEKEASYFLIPWRGMLGKQEPPEMETGEQRAHTSCGEGCTNPAAEVAVGSAFTLDRDFNVPSPRSNSAAISLDATYSVK